MKIKIYSETFLIFYTALLSKGKTFLSSEEREKTEYKNNSYKLWEMPISDGKTSVINKVMAPSKYAASYWNDRKSKHNTQIKNYKKDSIKKPASFPEEVFAMATALKFLGYKIPKKFRKDVSGISECQMLYKQFLIKQCTDFLKSNPDLKIHDSKLAGSSSEHADRLEVKLVSDVKMNVINRQNEDKGIHDSTPDDYNSYVYIEAQLLNVVTDYFFNLSRKKFSKLEDYWYPSQYDDSYDSVVIKKFLLGKCYLHSLELLDVICNENFYGENKAECKVLLTTSEDVFTLPEISDCKQLTFRDLDEFVEKLKTIKEIIKSGIDTDLSDIPIIEIFDMEINDHLSFFDKNLVESIFEKKESLVYRLLEVKFERANDNWYIVGCSQVKIHSVSDI